MCDILNINNPGQAFNISSMQNKLSSYLDALNKVQYQAVTHHTGPLLIIAGPGSGKTRVLTYRIAHLIDSGVKPWTILALTFTNKAAREIKERIASVVGDAATQVWAGTFHSVFARILRAEADKLNYPSSFTIYDTQDSVNLISNILKEQNLDSKVYPPRAVLNRISWAKTRMIGPGAYENNSEIRSHDSMAKRPQLFYIYQLYVLRCLQSAAMDFDDLLFFTYYLLNKYPELVEKYSTKFRFVMVDEFQDTNAIQYQIVKLLLGRGETAHRNICVVGDDAQSIYAFRGATIQNILDFERDFPDLVTYKLEQNYRSTYHIVQAANQVISRNQKQIKKVIWTPVDQTSSQPIKIMKAMTDTEEGRMVADAIIEQKNRYRLGNRDIAILYRTNAQSRIFEEFLRRQNINYRVFGGLSFYQRKEVKDVLAYLRLLVNTRDEEALRRVINLPARGIGKSTLDAILHTATDQNISMWEACSKTKLSTRATAAVKQFTDLIETLKKDAVTHHVYDMAQAVMVRSSLLKLYSSDTSIEGQTRLDNVQELLDGIKEFVESDELSLPDFEHDKSVSSYLASIALLTDADNDPDDNEYVSLMSTHAAKGLEFPCVFVVGLEENLFPSYQAEQQAGGMEEERRLFYVAITRAKKYLTLSFASSRYQYGQMRYNKTSRFLDEIQAEHLESTAPLNRQLAAMRDIEGKFPRPLDRKPVNIPKFDDFSAAPADAIQPGMRILHQRFGEGQIVSIDGRGEKRVATIQFEEADTKRIMLKFAKLKIL